MVFCEDSIPNRRHCKFAHIVRRVPDNWCHVSFGTPAGSDGDKLKSYRTASSDGGRAGSRCDHAL